MSCSLPARGARLLALSALAGTTAVTGALATAVPAVAAPVAVEGRATEVPDGTAPTGPAYYFNPVSLTNGDTAYGIHEDQPMAPTGDPVLDDENYALAVPFDDADAGLTDVVGEKVGDRGVYWEPGNAALAGYVLSVFGATEDANEALAVHWAVRSLSTAAAPAPELSGLEESHLQRAAEMIEHARAGVPSVTPQSEYPVSVSSGPDGEPRRLLVQLPEVHYRTTVTLSGPVTFADGSTEQTFTGGERHQVLDLAVPDGVTEGELTATLTATMPSTELTVLADGEYRDLLIAGQDREVTWSASAGFAIDEPDEPTASADPLPGDGTQPSGDGDVDTPSQDGRTEDAENVEPDEQPAAGTNDGDRTGSDGTDSDGTGDGHGRPAGNGAERAGDDDGSTTGHHGEEHQREHDVVVLVLEPAADVEPERRVTALLEAFVLFETRTSVHTEIVSETTMSSGGSAYAEQVMFDTGVGAPQAAGGRDAALPLLLAAVAVAGGLGSWALRRRKPSAAPGPSSAD